MMRRNTAAAGVIPAPADPDTISDSGSSTTPPPQPGREQQTNSVLQAVVRAGAPVIRPTPEDGQQPVAVEEITSQVVQGIAASTAMINRYLRAHGRIPMTRPALDLNAPAPPPHVDHLPVICVYCNCAFCFSQHEASCLDLGPGHVYPAPPLPITLNLLTPPAVGPLERDLRRPGVTPAPLLVCSTEHHFNATMGMLQQQPGGAPSLVWKCTPCLRVQPIVVGMSREGADSGPLELHDDPLKLTLGRR